jgi:hypothetical protein
LPILTFYIWNTSSPNLIGTRSAKSLTEEQVFAYAERQRVGCADADEQEP